MSDGLVEYIRDVMRVSSYIFRPLRREIRRMALELLEEGLYIDKVTFAATSCEWRVVVARCYDEGGEDWSARGTWKLDPSYISEPGGLRYTLDSIDLEETL